MPQTNRLPQLSVQPELTLEEFEYVRALVLMAWKNGMTRSTGERYVLLTLEAKLNQLADDITKAAQANGAGNQGAEEAKPA